MVVCLHWIYAAATFDTGDELFPLLQSQVHYDDGLVNWCRGLVVEMVMGIEELRLVVHTRHDIPLGRRIHLSPAYCRESDKALCLEYTECTADLRGRPCKTGRTGTLLRFTTDIPTDEIDDSIKGIIATYTMYTKADLSQA